MVARKTKAAPKARKQRARLTEAVETIFLAKLAETCNVAASARAADVTPGTMYRRRQRSAQLGARWREALSLGYEALEAEMLRRAIKGQRKTIFSRDGAKIATITEYDNKLGLSLLTLHHASVRGPERDELETDADDTLAALLSDMNKAMGGAG